MRREHPWKDGELRLAELAGALDMTQHYLSQVINEGLDMNFFELVNRYRVKEAERLLANPSNRNLTILHIAFESGFNNKTTFNKTFRELTGKTPFQYKRSNGTGIAPEKGSIFINMDDSRLLEGKFADNPSSSA